MQAIKSFLSQASVISKQNQEMATLTGEHFNIFSLLKGRTSEVWMHSTFVGDLLNVNGSHGQKDVFIKLFCDRFNIIDFNIESSKVEVEKFIYEDEKDKTQNYKIDILVTDNCNNSIIIDIDFSQNSLLFSKFSYYNYNMLGNEKYNLFCLTLFGSYPFDYPSSKNTIFNAISFSNDIAKWLDKCKEKSVNHQILRDTISQYCYLIKHLTGQTMNEDLKKELLDLIQSNGSNISAAIDISENVLAAKRLLLQRLSTQLNSKLMEMNNHLIISYGSSNRDLQIRLADIPDQYVSFSFLDVITNPYIEIYSSQTNEWKNKKNKLMVYYRSELDRLASSWGDILNTDKSFSGYWVCIYNKFGSLLNKNDFWSSLADNNANQIVEDIANDLLIVASIMKQRILLS